MEGSVDAQKQALLQAIAQQGTIGAQAHQAQSQGQSAAFNDALAANAASTQMSGPGVPSSVLAQINAQSGALHDTYRTDTNLANTAFGNAIGGISTANAAYSDQARAALPALREQTSGIIAQIQAEQQAEREAREDARKQREWEAMQREMDRQFAEEERNFQREQWEYEKSLMEQELENRGGLSEQEAEEFEANIEERRANIFGEVAQRGDGPAAAFQEITDTQPTFEGAMTVARRLVGDAVVVGDIPPNDREKELKELVRQLYAFYNPLAPTPSMENLPTVLKESGIDFGSVIADPDRSRGYGDDRAPFTSGSADAGDRSGGGRKNWSDMDDILAEFSVRRSGRRRYGSADAGDRDEPSGYRSKKWHQRKRRPGSYLSGSDPDNTWYMREPSRGDLIARLLASRGIGGAQMRPSDN
jgi:hypothetical protein